MADQHRMNRAWILGVSLAGSLLFTAQAPAEDAARKVSGQGDKQKQVQGDTNHMVRRISTMLRVLDYYQLDKSSEKKLLDEVAGILAGLSKEQMNEVIARLEKAAKLAGGKKSEQEIEEAYKRHREILDELRALLTRYDAVKSLDQAAGRLEKASKNELELHLHANQLIQDWQSSPEVSNDPNKKSRQTVRNEIHHDAEEQADVHKEVATILKQVEKIRDQLPADQQERLKMAEGILKNQQVLENLALSADEIKKASTQPEKLKTAADLQRKAAADLQDLARALRTPQDKLAALREARQRLDQTIAREQNVQAETQAQQDPRVQDMEKRKPDGIAKKAQELGDQQGRNEYATHDVQNILKPHAQDLADKLVSAEKAMRDAEEALRKNKASEAVKPENDAAKTLQDARKDLDDRIAKAEKERSDPLTALKKTKDTVEQIIKEQKDTQAKTKEAETAKKPDQLKDLAPKQQDLAKRTDDLNDQPTAAKPEAQEALDKAARAMDEATKDLKDKQGDKATAKQDEAVKALEDAKKKLNDQIAEIEKRRDDIAKLEDADNKLKELIKKEGDIADQAKDKAAQANKGDKPDPHDTKDLAKKQDAVTPQTKDIAKNLAKTVPEAAKRADDSAKSMESAKTDFDKNEAKPGAKDAKDATDKLKDAEKTVAKALENKKGEEIADQAAMQPSEVDPANAANQLAKAIEQAEKAATDSKEAASKLGEKSADKAGKPDLAKLQKQVADKAADIKADEASKPAADAAKDLEKGDLAGAIEQQKKALSELEAAAKADPAESGNKPMPGDKPESGDKPMPGTPTPSQAKNAGELAKAQKTLLDATKALAKSQEANAAAQAALEQAEAQAPGEVQPQLQDAGNDLAKADKELNQGTPTPANQSQNKAIGEMKQALGTLNAALAQMGQPDAKPGKSQQVADGKQPGEGNKPGQGQKPGQGEGKKPGQGKGKGKKPTQAQENNLVKGTGDRIADGKMNKTPPPKLAEVRGDGSFLHLPPKQRELIMQALSERLPPEYSALIRQYYVNLARGKPATKPMTPEKK